MASAAIINRLRLQRSEARPAGSVRSAEVRVRANATIPAFAGDCVTASTSSGYAIDVDDEPAFDSSCPACNNMKSRLRRRGTAVTKGADQIRTGVRGFAGLCLTTRPRRRAAGHGIPGLLRHP